MQGRNLMAIAYLSSASAAEPDNKECLLHLALAYDKLGRNADKLKTLEAIVRIDDKDLKSKGWLADTYYSEEEFVKAEELYLQILSSHYDPNMQLKLAEVQAWQKKYNKAVISLERIIRQNPDDDKAAGLLADIYTWNREYDKAIELLDILCKKYPQDNDIVLKYAKILAEMQDYHRAMEMLREILERDSKNKNAKHWLARILSWDKQYDRSINLYTELIEDNPTWLIVRREKARVLGWAHKYDEAVTEYEKAYNLDTSNQACRYEMLSKYNLYNQFYKAAVENYKQWLEYEPNNVEALFDLGQIYSSQMQWTNAKIIYNRIPEETGGHFRAGQALSKVDIYSKDAQLKTGFEMIKADSRGRLTNKRSWDTFASITQPLDEKYYLTLRQDNMWYRFKGIEQAYRQRFLVGLDYYDKPEFQAGAHYTYSDYPEEHGIINTFGGQIGYVPGDRWQINLSHLRDEVTDNDTAFLNKRYRDNYKIRGLYKSGRRMTIGADYMYSRYNNDNDRNTYGMDLDYLLSYEPRSLKITYRYEEYRFDRASPDYFSPDSFHYNAIGLQWRHFLNKEELFWGTNDTFYSIHYTVNFDVKNETGHKLYFDFHHDWNDKCSSHFEWSRMIYEHRDTYSENRLMFYMSVYF